MRPSNRLTLLACCIAAFTTAPAEGAAEDAERGAAPKPLYRDPVHDGAADPVVVWSRTEQKWFLLYTNRRANVPGLEGVSWVHGTRLGIAESTDQGLTWTYRGVADVRLGEEDDSHWAPEIVWHDGKYHLYLSFVPGMHVDWSGQRFIHHLVSTDLLGWRDLGRLPLASDRVIDAAVLRLPDGTWRLWYKNERDGSQLYCADSPDLLTWTDRGRVKSEALEGRACEGPKVVRWRGRFWMVADEWRGLSVYRSDDAETWERQPYNLLEVPGKGKDDQVKGGHPDLVINDDRAWLFYFTHPGRRGPDARKDTVEQRRSSIQVAEVEIRDGWLVCDRDRPARIRLVRPPQEPPYLFSYFTGNGEDGLHLAASEDGLTWKALRGGKSFLTPEVGSKLMRDPCVIQGPGGTFHMVWTSGWWDQGVGIAHSKDLQTWSKQEWLPVMKHEPGARNCWAPEILYDPATGEYLIYWSTTIPGRFPETEVAKGDKAPEGGVLNHRIYFTSTRDFKTYTKAALLYDPGFNCIDATIVPAEGRWLMFLKDETRAPVAKKNIRMAWADRPTGPWGPAGPPISPDWVEGPTALHTPDGWRLYYDAYRRGHFEGVQSKDLESWDSINSGISFPRGARHGTALSVPPRVLESLRGDVHQGIGSAADVPGPLRVHMISGSKEYQSESSLRRFKEYLESRYRVEVTASWVEDGARSLPGIKEVPDADLLIVFARRLKLPEDKMKVLRRHWESGKPVMGFRTASHAFQKADNAIFDRKVLGGDYQGHFGDQAVTVTATETGRKHPVLDGVRSFQSRKLYKAGKLADSALRLQEGTTEGGETHAVTWIHEYKGGRMFYTSLGVPGDFKDEDFLRMLVNAVFWTTRRDPESHEKADSTGSGSTLQTPVSTH